MKDHFGVAFGNGVEPGGFLREDHIDKYLARTHNGPEAVRLIEEARSHLPALRAGTVPASDLLTLGIVFDSGELERVEKLDTTGSGEAEPPGDTFEVKFLAILPDASALPPNGKEGDAYMTRDTGHCWAWMDDKWTDTGDQVAAELENFAKKAPYEIMDQEPSQSGPWAYVERRRRMGSSACSLALIKRWVVSYPKKSSTSSSPNGRLSRPMTRHFFGSLSVPAAT